MICLTRNINYDFNGPKLFSIIHNIIRARTDLLMISTEKSDIVWAIDLYCELFDLKLDGIT